uniref:Uncharacterized protein n=1 Tax=Salix viminalis TaxID=40686 RepID=A0A6N2K7H4_SALVM
MAVHLDNLVEEEENEEDNALFEGNGLVDQDSDIPPHLLDLARAAQLGDLDALRNALDNLNGSIDEPVEDGDTALHLTCLYGYSVLCSVLNCITNYFTILCSYSWKGEQTWRPRMKMGRFLFTMLAQGDLQR